MVQAPLRQPVNTQREKSTAPCQCDYVYHSKRTIDGGVGHAQGLPASTLSDCQKKTARMSLLISIGAASEKLMGGCSVVATCPPKLPNGFRAPDFGGVKLLLAAVAEAAAIAKMMLSAVKR